MAVGLILLGQEAESQKSELYAPVMVMLLQFVLFTKRQDREAVGQERFFVGRAEAVSPEKMRVMIRRDHSELSISQQCKRVRLSRSTFYYPPVGSDAATLSMMKEIDWLFTKGPFFGSRQIAAYLRRYHLCAGAKRVLLSVRHHGPGNAQGLDLAAIEYDVH